VGWHFIQNEVMLYLSQVEIVPEEFEQNRIEAEITAEYDDYEDLFNWDNVNHLEFFDVLNYLNYADEVNPTGELIIPRINLRLPIFHGTTDLYMTLGAGTTRPGMVMGEGNFVLGSHWGPAYNIRFGGIHLLELDDLIIMRDYDYLYIYEVVIANYVVHKSRYDITHEVEDKIYVTLFTCDSGVANTPYRVVVRGEFVEQLAIADLIASRERYEELGNLAEILAESLSEIANIEEMVETIIEVVEMLDDTRIPFPLLSVTLVIGGAFILASGAVWLSGKDFSKKK
jgi:LPXTG-site transpeptidase (sortase) family protein